jgi:hypothetical protein
MFISGSSRVQVIQRNDEKKWIRVTFVNSSTNKLPLAHTCFSQIECPRYETFDKMKKMLDTALSLGFSGYSFG